MNVHAGAARGGAWREARALVWRHRCPLALDLPLMVAGRVAGLVLPATPRWLIDEVIAKGRHGLLLPLALAVGLATLVEAGTSLALARVVGVAAQRAVAETRTRLQARVIASARRRLK